MGTFGFSTEKLKNIESYLQEKYIDTNRYVGTLTGIYRNGQLGFISTLGLMDRESRKPIKRDTIFRIYSMTKPITGVALMILVEEGKIRLDDPVKKYIPSFSKTKVFKELKDSQIITQPLNRDITIRDLATHTSGLSYAINEPDPVSNLYRERKIFPYYYPDKEGVSGTKSFKFFCENLTLSRRLSFSKLCMHKSIFFPIISDP